MCMFCFFSAAKAITTGFTRGTSEFWLLDISCRSQDTRIRDCPSRTFGLGIYSCGHSTEAGAVCAGTRCPQGTIRLQGGSDDTNNGRVEICNDDAWGTVCDSNWDNADARVVCRELGLPTAGTYCGTCHI